MTDTPDPTDVYVGSMVRTRRKMKDISQDALAQSIGVTFQQVQKYERGANRISASMLQRIADVLEAPVGSFFPSRPGDGRADLGACETMAMIDGGLDLAETFLALNIDMRWALVQIGRDLARATEDQAARQSVQMEARRAA